MLFRNYSPTDLASAVCSELNRRRTACPKLEDLIHLFEAMYFASLKTEEAQQIAFHIVYLDPNDPDPKPPMRITKDRWCFVRIAEPIPITISNLVKIAKASDPRTSSFVVYPNTQGELCLWGLVDQGNSYHDFINYDSESGGQRPGVFQASIVGVGHLVASIGYSKIAELKVNNILRNSLNVLEKGPVYDTIEPGIKAYIDKIKRKLPEQVFNNVDQNSNLRHYWISSLCRLLLRIKNYHHGGAILITPDNSFRGLNVKYRVQYERLRTSLETRALLTIQSTHASDEIFKAIANSADNISAELYLREFVHKNDLDDNRNELDGTIWFISLLTRVDGLVLMTPNLDVQGFGVEIVVSEEPPEVFVADNRLATDDRLRNVEYNHFGTRHRSMMRYCSQIPGSIGFVISQDGDVRAMTQVRNKLVVWENIKLQLTDFIPRRRTVRKGDLTQRLQLIL